MRRTVPPSAEIEAQIDQLLAVGVGENPRESLSELAKLGARLIIQRAVEDEFDAWLGRARYERRAREAATAGCATAIALAGCRPPRASLAVEIPQVREAAEPFVSALFPRGTKLLRTEPLKAMVIGAFVRGLSMRDVESLCEKAGLGKLSKSTASRICRSCASASSSSSAATSTRSSSRRCSSTRSSSTSGRRAQGGRAGRLGLHRAGRAGALSVMLGMRESHEDWLALGSDLIARGLGAPMLIVADGAPGLIKAIEQCWPASDRQHCAVHRVRNLLAKLPERERERVRQRLLEGARRGDSERDGKPTARGPRRRARAGRLHLRREMSRR